MMHAWVLAIWLCTGAGAGGECAAQDDDRVFAAAGTCRVVARQMMGAEPRMQVRCLHRRGTPAGDGREAPV